MKLYKKNRIFSIGYVENGFVLFHLSARTPKATIPSKHGSTTIPDSVLVVKAMKVGSLNTRGKH